MTDITLRTRLDGASQVREGLHSVGQAADELQAKAVAIGATLGTALGALIYEGISRITSVVKESVVQFAEYGERIEKIQKQTGLAADTLGVLDFAAKNNNLSMESLALGFRMFARQVEAAAAGNEKARDAFKSLGVSIDDIRKLDVDALFRKSVESIGKMEEGTQRAATATRLFGISGRNIQVIADGFSESAKKAEEFGFILDDKALAAALRLDDQLDLMNRRLEASRRRLAADLAPAIELVFELISNLMDLLRKNAPSIGESMTKLFGDMTLKMASTTQEIRVLAAAWDFFTGLFSKPEGTLGERWQRMRDEMRAASQEYERTAMRVAMTTAEVSWPGQTSPRRGGATDTEEKDRASKDNAAHEALVERLTTESRLMKEVQHELKALADAREKEWKVQEDAMRAAAGAEAHDVANKIKQREAYEDLADPMRVFARQLELIDELQEKYGLSADAAARATQKAAEDMERASGNIKEKSPWDDLLREVQGFGRQFTDHLYNIITGTENAFKGLMKSIGEIFSKKILHAFITKPFEEALERLIEDVRNTQSEIGGGFGGLLSAVGGALGKSLFGGSSGGESISASDFSSWGTEGSYFSGSSSWGGGFARGGYLPAGYSAIVGEDGIERVTAGRSGLTVEPISAAGGPSFTFNIAAGVSRAEVSALIPMIKAETLAAMLDAKRRGGRYSGL